MKSRRAEEAWQDGRRKRPLLRALALYCTVAAAAAAGVFGGDRAEAEAGGTVVLNENTYWRVFREYGRMPISARALKAEGKTLLGDEGLRRLERDVKRCNKNADWSKTDWMDTASTWSFQMQGGTDRDVIWRFEPVAPPQDWSGPDFDDHSWMRRRMGSPPLDQFGHEGWDGSAQAIRAVYLRTYFAIPDPSRVQDLTLRITYHGGARVFVNGLEVASSHLPAGTLPPDARGEDYPKEAYLADDGKTFVGDLRCRFEDAPADARKNANLRDAFGVSLDRGNWERLMGLRDRTLGPVAVAPKLLRKGRNVLAIEVRGSAYHPIIFVDTKARVTWLNGYFGNPRWPHAELVGCELRSSRADIPSGLRRPAGTQVWAEDIHTRVFSPDFNPPGWPAGMVRMAGAVNGTFSGLLVVGTDKGLAGLKATVSDLRADAGSAAIPGSAMQALFMKPHPLRELARNGYGRCLGEQNKPECPMAMWPLWRYTGSGKREGLDRIQFFDHISAWVPQEVPADTCQPIWLSLKVPADASPGRYRGSVSVEAAGTGLAAVPVELEVFDWRVPNPLEFKTVVASEQSPYGVADQYKAPLWSDEHFKLMEASFRQLARLGNDMVFVPVIHDTEMGNLKDSPIRWIRERDGTLAFDYTTLDRYLDLAIKHLGVPEVICFHVMQGAADSPPAEVTIQDEATGREELVDVGREQGEARNPLWTAFAKSLHAHMKSRGLIRSMFWGYAYDSYADMGLIDLLASVVPDVYWAAGSHNRTIDKYFHAVSRAYGTDLVAESLKGWKRPFGNFHNPFGTSDWQVRTWGLSEQDLNRIGSITTFENLLMPRYAGSIICVEGTCPPFPYRLMVDRALHCGFGGIGRMGADYFADTWFKGCKTAGYLIVGRSCVMTLWPGKDGAESSARWEAMREGVQEAEARIFLEQTQERKTLPKELSEEIDNVIDARLRETLYIYSGWPSVQLTDYAVGWQERSRRLLDLAARVARQVGVDADRGEVQLRVAALGKRPVALRIRNWTSRPRAWEATASAPWIVLAKSRGTLSGQETLVAEVDGAQLRPGQTVEGSVTVADLQTGTRQEVRLIVAVDEPLALEPSSLVFNVSAGGKETGQVTLGNRTMADLPWEFSASVPWLTAAPSSGRLRPGESLVLTMNASPPDREAATHNVKVVMSVNNGAVKQETGARVFVIPPYAPPKPPSGQAIYLEDVPLDGLLKSHRTGGLKWWFDQMGEKCKKGGLVVGPENRGMHMSIGSKKYDHGLWVVPEHETVFNIAGRGYTGFSAEAGRNTGDGAGCPGAFDNVRVNFEIYVDGKVRAQSGLMRRTDAPRLMAVDLAGAKELKLVTRLENLGNSDSGSGAGIGLLCHWAEAKFYREK